jgi:2-polyprenyl-3-methyl-5-hydroxy-6-metoxy-1,4-benzoquinol methylase
MISPKEFLETELANGISADNANFMQLAKQTVNQLRIDYSTVLDFGAGTGVYSEAFRQSGKYVKAYEIWKEHREYISHKFPLVWIVDQPVTTDLMLFIEVAEHMTDDELVALMSKINPKFILFSSTSQVNPGFDEDWGHINIKQQSDWIQFWARCGYEFVQDLGFPTSWSKLFKIKGS